MLIIRIIHDAIVAGQLNGGQTEKDVLAGIIRTITDKKVDGHYKGASFSAEGLRLAKDGRWNEITSDHAVPVSFLANQIIDRAVNGPPILDWFAFRIKVATYLTVVAISKDEDSRLTATLPSANGTPESLKQMMPWPWQWGDDWAKRYDDRNIRIAPMNGIPSPLG